MCRRPKRCCPELSVLNHRIAGQQIQYMLHDSEIGPAYYLLNTSEVRLLHYLAIHYVAPSEHDIAVFLSIVSQTGDLYPRHLESPLDARKTFELFRYGIEVDAAGRITLPEEYDVPEPSQKIPPMPVAGILAAGGIGVVAVDQRTGHHVNILFHSDEPTVTNSADLSLQYTKLPPNCS